MKYLWLLLPIFLLSCGGDSTETNLTFCTVNLAIECGGDPNIDDEVQSAGLSCSQGDICGTQTNIDVVVATDGLLSDLLATAKFLPATSDLREILEK